MSLTLASIAFVGAIWDYVKQYQLGIDYTSSYDSVDATYETANPGVPAESCAVSPDDPTRQECAVAMKAGGASGFGLFLQQAFKKQGTFYFKPDVGFGVRSLQGELSPEHKKRAEEQGLPLKELSFDLVSFVVKPYITLGVTPSGAWLPDVLLSLGPAAQIAVGKVKVNDESENVALATSSGKRLIGGFFEFEVVFLRFGEGAFSLFTSRDVTSGEDGTKLITKDVDGMDDFRASFARSVSGGVFGFGAKLVLPFP